MRLRSTALTAVFVLVVAACGGDDGANADDLCEREVTNAIDDLLNGSGDVPEDFDTEREALAVVRAAADGDLDQEVESVEGFLDDADQALEGVDRDDEEEVAEAFEDFDADDFEEVNGDLLEIAELVDDECDTEIVADFTGDTGEGEETEETDDTADTDDTDDTAVDDEEAEDTSLEDFADLVESCEGGDMADCDQLFLETPIGSEAEDVGRTCGGEGDETTAGRCEELFG